jgi:hypothetical protein
MLQMTGPETPMVDIIEAAMDGDTKSIFPPPTSYSPEYWANNGDPKPIRIAVNKIKNEHRCIFSPYNPKCCNPVRCE